MNFTNKIQKRAGFVILSFVLLMLYGCSAEVENSATGSENLDVVVNVSEENQNAISNDNQPDNKKEDKNEDIKEDKKGDATNNNGGEVTQPVKTGGHVIVIDPGHQKAGDSNKEPDGPGSANMKARVSSGTVGRFSGIPEYILTLKVSLALRDELVSRGYVVYMTREVHDINISNKERAELATNMGAELSIRIHANGADDASISGALTLCPSSSNKYVSNLYEKSYKLSKCVLDSYCASTGLRNQGVMANDTMTGINWCTVPVTILEMGYMTNENDDYYMNSDANLSTMVKGIADGVDKYFLE